MSTSTSTTSNMPTGAQQRRNTHRLPAWMNWIQENVLLSFLVLTEAYLLGSLFTMGWVANMDDPGSWGYFHGVGVILFFGAGACCGGIALRCSAVMWEAFSERRLFLALGNLLGLAVFSAADIWASIVERALHLQPGAADLSVLAALNIAAGAIGPTLVVVSILLPFATFYAGNSRGEVSEDTIAQRDREHDLRMQRARQHAELRALQVQGLATVAGGGIKAIRAQLTQPKPDDLPPENPDDGEDTGAALVAGEAGLVSGGKQRPPLRLAGRTDPLRGRITAEGLVAWVKQSLQKEITYEEALRLIKTVPGHGATKGVQGSPVSAPKQLTLQRARALWADAAITLASAS